MPELDLSDPHRANATRRWNPAEVTRENYVYRGQGFDIFEEDDDGED